MYAIRLEYFLIPRCKNVIFKHIILIWSLTFGTHCKVIIAALLQNMIVQMWSLLLHVHKPQTLHVEAAHPETLVVIICTTRISVDGVQEYCSNAMQ